MIFGRRGRSQKLAIQFVANVWPSRGAAIALASPDDSASCGPPGWLTSWWGSPLVVSTNASPTMMAIEANLHNNLFRILQATSYVLVPIYIYKH